MSKRILLLISILFSLTTVLISCKNDSSIKTLNYQSAITEDNEDNLEEAIEEKKETVQNKTTLDVVENSKKSDSTVKQDSSTISTPSTSKTQTSTPTTVKSTDESKTTSTSNTTPVDNGSSSVTPSPATNNDDSGTIHFKSQAGYTIDFPKSWEGKYTINENPESLTVIFKTDYPTNGAPWLFTVSVANTVNQLDYDTIGSKKLINVGNTTYFIGGPTGLTLNENNPDFDTYLKMGNERYKVVNSIKVP